MAKKKRKPMHGNPQKAVAPKQPVMTEEERRPTTFLAPLNILGMLLMVAGIVLASIWSKTTGGIISIMGSALILMNTSLKGKQTPATLLFFIVYVFLVANYAFR